MHTSPILVTGASGGVQGATGNLIVKLLLGRGFAVRAFVHRIDNRSDHLQALGAEIVQGDLLDVQSVRSAMQGIDRAYFCYPVKAGLLEAGLNFAVAAQAAGTTVIVNLSQGAAMAGHPSPASRQHWLIERAFDWANIGAIHVRGAVFFENLKRHIADSVAIEGKFYLPFGQSDPVLPLVAGEDVARVVAGILANPQSHLGKTYSTTTAVMTLQEITTVLSQVLHKPIEYIAVPVERYQQALIAREGAENVQQIQHLTVLWQWLAQAKLQKGVGAGQITDVVQTIGGSVPKTFETFVREQVSAFENAVA